MAHKFNLVGEIPKVSNPDKPVLFIINLASMYYIHKGKKLEEQLEYFLSEVDRGLRGLKCNEYFQEALSYCKGHPSVNKYSVELIFNGAVPGLLSKELQLLKKGKKDPACLNDPKKDQYKPEWMQKEMFHKRCENGSCVSSGEIAGKKVKFRFCPNCGHIPKQIKAAN